MQEMTALRRWIGLMAVACSLALVGCASEKPSDSAKADATKKYQMKGEIKGLDADQHVATIKHEDIPGFMGAMTMGYPIKDPAEFSKLAVGEPITATVYVKGDEMWVGNIQKAGAKGDGITK
jgi:protein SCO1/2